MRARRHLQTTPLGPLMDKPLSATNGCASKPTFYGLLAGEAAVMEGHGEEPNLEGEQRPPCGHSVFRTSAGPLPEAPIE